MAMARQIPFTAQTSQTLYGSATAAQTNGRSLPVFPAQTVSAQMNARPADDGRTMSYPQTTMHKPVPFHTGFTAPASLMAFDPTKGKLRPPGRPRPDGGAGGEAGAGYVTGDPQWALPEDHADPSSTAANGKGLPDWALPVGIVAVAGIAAFLILR